MELAQQLKTLKINEAANVLDEILLKSQEENHTYQQFLDRLLSFEIKKREQKDLEKRLKWAAFPEIKRLEDFDTTKQPAISNKQLNQLKELLWMEHAYNLILLGPPGVGKTFIATGLGLIAVEKGYNVSFIQMDTLMQLLKTKDITRSSKTRVNRMLSAHLIIIDDLMFIEMDKNEANLFFQFINKLYNQSSIIITSNKGPKDWGELLGDQAITTAILDRILHKSEVINLKGDSYRIQNRNTIFGNF